MKKHRLLYASTTGLRMSDEERQRIREEEIFRAEVRREIEESHPPPSGTARLVAFLNTSLGLWILGTVLVSGFGFLYQNRQLHIEQEAARTSAVEKLYAEVAYRLLSIENRLLAAERPTDLYNAAYDLVHSERQYALLPENRERNLFSLLFELRTNTRGREQARLDSVLQDMNSLRRYLALHADPPQQVEREDIETRLTRLFTYKP